MYKEINDIMQSDGKKVVASSQRSDIQSNNNKNLPPKPFHKRTESAYKVPKKYNQRRKITSTEMLNNFITNKLPDLGANTRELSE